MHLTVDKFGRVLLPKTVRDDFALTPGSSLEIEELSNAILLRPVPSGEEYFKKDGGVLIYTGAALERVEQAVSDQRKSRIRSFLLHSKQGKK